jgi:hypothetical protein
MESRCGTQCVAPEAMVELKAHAGAKLYMYCFGLR